ncbi:major facilitator superfamily domain-containing protein [Mycena latifolia]|nr:major facilitator superfamily domain-containing protein [Mycena latifolia]
MNSPSNSIDEKRSDDKVQRDGVEVSVVDIDTAATLVSGDRPEIDAAEAQHKIDYNILPFMYNKATLGSAAILGIREEAHLTTNQYNWLGTVFYLSYLAFEFPQNLALQRFPVAKWMSITIFVWGVALCAHAACKNFAGLLVVRLILGMCEGRVFLIVSSMFYTHKEQTIRVGYWSQIISGFISFGTLQIKTSRLEPVVAVLRIKAGIRKNQTGVENKHFKKEQMMEALSDPKTWLFALFSALTNVPNRNQRTIIVSSFGFTNLQTTLLSCVDGVVEVVTIWTGVLIAAKTNQRAYVAFCYKIPNIIGAILVNTLPWSNKIGLVFSLWVTGVGTTVFVIALSWMSSVTAGHTKRVTTNAIMLIAYCTGNAVGPFMWQAKYKPRNHVPWIIIGLCFVSCMAILLIIRFVLAAENKRRDAEPVSDDMYKNVYVERLNADGVMEKVKVDKEFLDLTDVQNRDFRYVL